MTSLPRPCPAVLAACLFSALLAACGGGGGGDGDGGGGSTTMAHQAAPSTTAGAGGPHAIALRDLEGRPVEVKWKRSGTADLHILLYFPSGTKDVNGYLQFRGVEGWPFGGTLADGGAPTTMQLSDNPDDRLGAVTLMRSGDEFTVEYRSPHITDRMQGTLSFPANGVDLHTLHTFRDVRFNGVSVNTAVGSSKSTAPAKMTSPFSLVVEPEGRSSTLKLSSRGGDGVFEIRGRLLSSPYPGLYRATWTVKKGATLFSEAPIKHDINIAGDCQIQRLADGRLRLTMIRLERTASFVVEAETEPR